MIWPHTLTIYIDTDTDFCSKIHGKPVTFLALQDSFVTHGSIPSAKRRMCFFDSPQTIHIFIFSFFSGNTIRFMFSGISYLRTYLVHLVQFSRSVVSDSLRPHEPQHARPPCLPPTPGVHPNSCPLSQWCHPTTSSSVVPFSSCFQSFPTSRSFQMSQLFTSGG